MFIYSSSFVSFNVKNIAFNYTMINIQNTRLLPSIDEIWIINSYTLNLASFNKTLGIVNQI